MDSEELMKKSAIVLAGAMLLVACKKTHADYVAVPRQVIADYNTALTEAQERAAAYQKSYERLAHKVHAKEFAKAAKKDKKHK